MPRKRLFYGWKIVGVSFVTLSVSMGIWYSFSVFFIALLKEFGWSRAATAGVFSLFTMVHYGAGFVTGSLLDRFGARRVIPFGSVLVVIGLLASSQIGALWHLYICYSIVTAMGFCSIGFLSHSMLLPNWFSKKRGLAMGIAMAGIGVGMFAVVPATQALISHFGWRAAYCALAAIVLVVVIPINAILQRRNPEEIGELPDGEIKPILSSEDPIQRDQNPLDPDPLLTGRTLRDTARTGRFWLLSVTFFFTAMAIQGTLIHQVAHVVDKGFSAEIGSFFFGLSGIMGSVGKILFGHLSDKLGREKAFAVSIGCAFLGVLSLMALQQKYGWLLYGYAIFFGLGYGSVAPIYPARAADLFHGPEFGKIYGLLAMAGGLGGALGAWLSGMIFDVTGSYHFPFVITLVILIVIVILFWFTSPTSPKNETTDG